METAQKIETGIPVRNMRFKFAPQSFPVHYAKGNPLITHMFNTQHIVFPEGEKFFIRSVRRFLPEVKDPKLAAEVRDFIGQEAVHFREHEAFWKVMEAQGLKPSYFIKFYNFTAYTVLEKWMLSLLSERYSAQLKLAITAALEHYTAMLASVGLAEHFYIGKMYQGISEEIRYIFTWHAMEELEHKSVAFDVMKEVGVSNAMRKTAYIFATIFLVGYIYSGIMYFLLFDRSIKWKKMGHYLKEFKDHVLLQAAMVKSKRKDVNIEKLWRDYLRNDFHPKDHDTTYLQDEFMEDSKEWMAERLEGEVQAV